ncbi:Crotonyl-CoA reductase [Lacunisphaera limnophila]|uniref:Crotonyl-CoA reductase n=1 Tax=Lacunisphaera limnophila TaxID=1838286 RepID=A0A1D8ASX3_9BACT|nr:zinc-binding dehydrogenase [Lacunisphaera limnophila]AOS43995.1 Crotonyl-CoA reductase [Lacunisphaera limnophila]
MQAALLRATNEPVTVQPAPDPVPAAGQAVVRLRAAALNHRDLWIQLGQYAGIKLPLIPGSDGAGVVTAVGAPGDDAWSGREVIINPSLDWGDDPRTQGPGFRILGLPDAGTFAEQIAIPVANLASKPAHLTWEQAAALPLAGLTAWRALFTRAGLQSGEKILITGIGGGAALFALQFAVAAGAQVWVTSSSPEKIARAQTLGAAGGVNYRDTDWPATLTRAAGGPFDVVLDSAGGAGFGPLIELVRPGGRLVFFGATTGQPPGLDLRKCFFRQLTLLGTTMGSPADFAGMTAFVARHRIVPVVDRVFPLAETDQALRHMAAGAQFGKIVLATG